MSKSGAASAGDQLELTPESLVAGGDAIARIDGYPVFVEEAYPGDRVLVEITRATRGFARARVIELIESSPLRRLAPCPVARECGGCDWTELRLDAQLRAKRDILSESLRRVGKIPPASLPAVRTHASPLEYRLRARLHVAAGQVGFYARRTKSIVPLPDACEILPSAMIPAIRAAAGEIESGDIDAVMTSEGIVVSKDERSVSLTAAGRLWRTSTKSFFQGNRHLLGRIHGLIDGICASAGGGDLALDLYGGVGFLAAPLSSHYHRVISIESADSSRWVEVNFGPGSGVEGLRANAAEALERFADEADFIVFDPPRAGLDREIISALRSSRSRHVAYLSCDPVTFSRDANRMIATGWDLVSLDLIDLFPNTHHLETLGHFSRK